jgi:alkyldihydroxyacetonephosphate synthase
VAQWSAIKAAVNHALVAHGATISHHHGVGADHRAWLAAEVGPVGVQILRAVKATVDPAGVLNPGKLVP